MITVFGLGFVGLTTALGFAHLGYTVYGIDANPERIELLEQKQLPFYEPHMQEVLEEELGVHLHLDSDVLQAVKNSEYIFYCVGTPCGANGEADLSALFSAIDDTVAAIDDACHRVLIVKSTIPPGTTERRIAPKLEENMALASLLHICNNPEFLREGHCWKDFMEADRIVIGSDDGFASEKMYNLYLPMEIPIYCVTASTGEFIKYLSNTLLATLISFSNEMAQVADAIGHIQVAEAFRILHKDKRWKGCDMTSYVYPGCGYGGYCLPKDTRALCARSEEYGVTPSILKAVIETNDNRTLQIASQIAAGMESQQVIGVLGLAFKPGSDDVRDTPAYKIISQLNKLGFQKIAAYDPLAAKSFADAYPDVQVQYHTSMAEVYDAADVVAIVTAWPEFKEVKNLGSKPLIDCRYML